MTQARSSPSRFVALLLVLTALAVVLARLPFSASAWANFTTVFLGIFIEAVPFLLLGTFASGLVEVYVAPDTLRRFLPDSPALSVLLGSLLGLFFPVCECGVVPLVRRLFRKGLPLPAGIAFLLAAPVVNPVVILSTLAAFGLGQILLMRVGFTLAIAIITGLVFAAVTVPGEVLRPMPAEAMPEVADHSPEVEHPSTTNPSSPLRGLVRVFEITLSEFFEIGVYLVLGGLITAGMQTFVPQSLLLSLGRGPVVSVVAMMGLAILLSVCSTVDSFVALGFVGIFSTGSILGFLLYGPMVDIKSTLMFLHVLRPRAVAYLVIIPFLLAFLVSVGLNYALIR